MHPLCSLSHVRMFVIPWTAALQGPLSMEFSRQEYWSGLPFSPPEDLPNPRIKPLSPALQADSLPSEPPGKPLSDTGFANIFFLPFYGLSLHFLTESFLVSFETQKILILMQPYFTGLLFNFLYFHDLI